MRAKRLARAIFAPHSGTRLPLQPGPVAARHMSRSALPGGIDAPREIFGEDHAAWRETCAAFFRDQVGDMHAGVLPGHVASTKSPATLRASCLQRRCFGCR